MKKLLSMLAVSTLVGTSDSNLKPMFTSNVSQGFKSNQKNNVSTHVPEPLWTDLKYQAKPYSSFQKMNDNQGIIDSECVDTKGNFRRLIYNEQDIFGTVFQFNSDISVMVDNNRNILLLDKNLKFTLLKNNVGYVVFEKMNDNLGLISFNKKTFLLNYLGQFTEIKKDNKDINGQITRMSDTMALFQDDNDSSYLLDISDPLKPNWTELKLNDLNQKEFTRMSDTMALFQDDNDSSYLLDISDPLKPNWTELKLNGQAVKGEFDFFNIDILFFKSFIDKK